MGFYRKKRLSDGSLGDYEKLGTIETDKEKIERIEADNAQLIYASMMKDLKMEEMDQSHSELVYTLMVKGVL